MSKGSDNHPKPSKRAPASSMRLALENRLLFDGAVVVTAVQVMDDKAAQDQGHDASKDVKADVAPPDAVIDSANSPVAQVDLMGNKDFTPQPQAITAAASAGNPGAPTLFVVDSRAQGMQELFTNPPANTEIKVLDTNKDGYQQIAQILHDRGNTANLQIIAADLSGKQWLGSSQLTSNITSANSASLTDWGDDLASNANIVFHSQEAISNSWLNHVNALTGGKVSASQDSALEVTKTLSDQNNASQDHTIIDGTLAPTNLTGHEIIFIDAVTNDLQTYITDHPNADVVLLDANRDGMEQMAAVMAGRTGIESVHILSHGASGQLSLGNGRLDLAGINGQYADELATIQAALSADADILIYGCDVATGETGLAFVNALAAATGADIAASTDTTGSSSLGGNWGLEFQTGLIEEKTIAASDWQGSLAPLVISTANNQVPIVVGTGAVGTTALWANAGTVGGSNIDLRATVMAITGPNAGKSITFSSVGDDPSILLNAGAPNTAVSYAIKWEVFLAGTTTVASGSPSFGVADIDGTPTGGDRESILADRTNLVQYTTNAPTTLVPVVSGGSVGVKGTFDDVPATSPGTKAEFEWTDVSSWTLTYSLAANTTTLAARFNMDGDGDLSFPSPVVASFAPVAVNDTFTTPEDTPVTINVRANDSDPQGDTFNVTNVNGIPITAGGAGVAVTGGVVTLNASGDLVFTPNPNFVGAPSFTYTITDQFGAPATATVTGTVTPENDPPVAVPDSVSVPEGTNAPVNLSGTDVDGTVTAVTVTALPPASQGILTKADGSPVVAGVPLTPAEAAGLVFKPAPNFNGTATVPFTVTDNNGAISAPTNATITVTPANDPPVAISGSTNTPADTNAPVDLTGTDVDGTVTSVTVTSLPPPSQGILYLPDGKTPVTVGVPLSPAVAAGLIFDPAPSFNGIVTIPFTVTDNTGETSPRGDFVIDVAEVDNDPVATPTTLSGLEDTPVPVKLTGTDDKGPISAVTVTSLPPASQGVLTKADGTPVVAGTPLTTAEAKALKFVPAPNFNGTLTIPFTVTDSAGQISSPPANLTINIGDVNDPPVAISVSPTGNEDSPIPVNLAGTDVDGTVRSVTVTTLPPATEGILYLADGKTPVIAGVPLSPTEAAGLIFKPAPNFNGPVKIPFTVTDNDGAVSLPANANITVAPVNDPPVAISGSTNTLENTNAPVNLAGTDVDGTVKSVTVTTLPPITQGILYLPDGTTPVIAGTPLTPAEAAGLIFTPTTNFKGLVDIPFTVIDDNGATSPAGKFVIDVAGVDNDPVATPTSFNGTEDTPVPVNLTGTDIEGPITAVTVTKLPPASQGILTKANGTPVVAGIPLTPDEAAGLIFNPAPNFSGTLTIPFTVTDSVGQVSSPPADLTINIGKINDPPIANDDGPIAIKPNTPAKGNVLTGLGGGTADIDPEGDRLTVTQFTIPGVGTFSAGKTAAIPGIGRLVINKDGSFTFTPNPGYSGPVPSAVYTITDGTNTDTATLSFVPVPKAPNLSTSNIGSIILLSNPTPPLFPPSTGASFSLLPEEKPDLTKAAEELDKSVRPSMYGDLQDYDLYLTGSLRNQVVLELQKYSFSIPPGTFRHTNPNEQLQYKATRSDGSPLTDWLKFNAKKLKFSGVPPRGSANVDVLVKALDTYGNEAFAAFKVTVNKERIDTHRNGLKLKSGHHAQVSEPINQHTIMPGKLAFNEQLNSSGKLSRLMESRALLDSLNQL
jgi:hypothetical protein